MLKTALTNKSIEKGRALEGAGGTAGRVDAREAAARLHRPVHRRAAARTWPTRNRRRSPSSTPTCRPRPSDDEIAAAVAAAIAETGATNAKDMGKVMKAVMAGLAGKTVDGKKVSEAVKAQTGLI